MKTLSQYVNDNYLYEGLSESDIQLLNEGIGSVFGKLFGWASGKTQNMVKDFKDSYETTLANVLAAKKSKDKKVQQDSKELQDKLKDCKSEEEALEKYMEYAETLLRTLDKVDDPLWAISVRNVLNKLSKKLDDKDASNMASKLDKAINEKWPEKDVKTAAKTLEKTEEALEKKAKKEANKKGESEESAKSEKDNKSEEGANSEEVAKEVADAITEEKDVLGPLAKEAGLDGNTLLKYITRQLTTNKKIKTETGESENKDKAFDPNAKDFDKEKFDKLVLGMCITICGAIITQDNELFAKIPDYLGLKDLDVNDLKKKVKKSEYDKKRNEQKKSENNSK